MQQQNELVPYCGGLATLHGPVRQRGLLGLDLLETLLFRFDSEPEDDKDLHDQ